MIGVLTTSLRVVGGGGRVQFYMYNTVQPILSGQKNLTHSADLFLYSARCKVLVWMNVGLVTIRLVIHQKGSFNSLTPVLKKGRRLKLNNK